MAGVKFKKTLKGDEYVIYECPNCDASLNSPIDEIGIQDTCPECNSQFVVPGTEQLEARRNAASVKKEEAESEALLRKREQNLKRKINEDKKQESSSFSSPSERASDSNAEHDLYFSNRVMFADDPIGFILLIALIPVFGLVLQLDL